MPELLENQFRFQSILGSGGMGVVYEAWDTRLERRVALKVLHPHLTAEAGNRDRLLREARLAARIEHPGVVRIYGIHEYEGALALEMQYVEGTPLNRLLAARPVSPAQAADLLRQVLEALAACHAQGVIHGDLKPGNLLVTADGKVLLTDFGISKAFHMEEGSACPSVSLSSPLWGTPQYSPPEAWEGGQPTPQWDLYALGVLAYEALAGSLPFNAQTPAILMREKLDRPHASIRELGGDLSPELAELMDSLKARQPVDRPQTANAALQQLGAVPESRQPHDGPATQPFCHTVQPAPATGPLTRSGSPYPTLSTFSPPPARPWKIHLAWISVLAIAAAAILAMRPPKPVDAEPSVPSAPPIGKPGEVLDLIVTQDTAYFSYDDGEHGRELWSADFSGQAELLADINPGPGSSNPRNFMERPSTGIMFSAFNPEYGEEPWYCSNGNGAHTVFMIKDIIVGPISSEPRPLAAWAQVFMFHATTLQQGTELWLSNTLEAQTGILKDLSKGGGSSAQASGNVLADSVGAYFVAQSTENGWRLWRFTYEDSSLRDCGAADKFTGEMALLGNHLFVEQPDAEHGVELWSYDPESNSLSLFSDILPGPESSYPEQFFAWNDRLYFQARTMEHGAELWATDGTPEGTREVADIKPGADDSAPYGFVATEELLFFRAKDAAHGEELWVTDGTSGGTRLVGDVRPGGDSSSPYNIAVIGGQLFFSADDGAHGEELWALNFAEADARPHLVEDLWPGATSSEPHDLTATGENTGIFVYKTKDADALMRLEVQGNEIELFPYSGLRRAVSKS